MTKIELLNFLNNPDIPDETELKVLVESYCEYVYISKVEMVNQAISPFIVLVAD